MKKEKPEETKAPENPLPEATSAKVPPAKSSNAKKPKREKKSKQTDDLHLPVLVELTYTFATILFISVGLAMVIVSVLTGADLLNLVLRTSAALFAMGSLLLLITWQISSGVLQVSIAEQEEAHKAQTEPAQQTESKIEETTLSETASEAGSPDALPVIETQVLTEGS